MPSCPLISAVPVCAASSVLFKIGGNARALHPEIDAVVLLNDLSTQRAVLVFVPVAFLLAALAPNFKAEGRLAAGWPGNGAAAGREVFALLSAGTTAAASHSCARVAVQCHSTIQGECTPSLAGPGDDRVAGERENASCKNSVRVWSGRTVLNLDHS